MIARHVALLLLASLVVSSGCRRPEPTGHGHGHPHGGADEGGHAHEEEGDTTSFTLFTDRHELFVELDLPVAGQRMSHHAHVTRLSDNAPAKGGSFGVAFTAADDPERIVQAHGVNDVAREGIFTPSGSAPSEPGRYRLLYRYQAGDEVAEWDAGVLEVGSRAIEPTGGREGEIRFLKETSWKLPFRIRRPELARIARPVTMPAHVEADPRLSGIVTAPASGRVLWTQGGQATIAGRAVGANEPIGRLVPESSYASWNALELTIRQARIEHERAAAELGRLEALLDGGLVSERRVLDARAARAAAAAALEGARRERAARTGDAPPITLRAPLDGLVLELLVEHDERAEAGRPLARLASVERVLIHGTLRGVDPDELDQLAHAKARSLDSGRSIDLLAAGAQLLVKPRIVDRRTAGLPVSWSVPNDGGLRIGQLLELSLGLGEGEARLTIPTSAVVEINTRPHAFVQVTGESFEQRKLVLGASDGERVAVLAGLEASDRVVTEGGFDVYVASLAGTVESHRH